LLLHALVTAAALQDRDCGVLLLATLFGQFPFPRKMFVDGAYAGQVFQGAIAGVMPRWRSGLSNVATTPKASSWNPNAGSSSAHRLAQSMSPSRQGLRKSQPQRPRFPPPRLDPPHAQKALPHEVSGRTLKSAHKYG
jgi:hypothetical protein